MVDARLAPGVLSHSSFDQTSRKCQHGTKPLPPHLFALGPKFDLRRAEQNVGDAPIADFGLYLPAGCHSEKSLLPLAKRAFGSQRQGG
jgi:hypothetical protein